LVIKRKESFKLDSGRLKRQSFFRHTLKNNTNKTKLMGKFDYLNNEVIKMFNLNSNNSNIGDLLPNGNDLEISSLRKHISRLRNNEGFKRLY
jgi:hypothetical protein